MIAKNYSHILEYQQLLHKVLDKYYKKKEVKPLRYRTYTFS
tara:strand:- start:1267 stop:1389 length:123 start_codon:yes stop_codon:yes gene_type:complete